VKFLDDGNSLGVCFVGQLVTPAKEPGSTTIRYRNLENKAEKKGISL